MTDADTKKKRKKEKPLSDVSGSPMAENLSRLLVKISSGED